MTTSMRKSIEDRILKIARLYYNSDKDKMMHLIQILIDNIAFNTLFFLDQELQGLEEEYKEQQ